MSAAQKFARVFGAVYVLVGILGFIPQLGGTADFSQFATYEGTNLLGIFEINVLHNIVHLLIGALLLFGSSSDSAARNMCTLVGVVYLLVGILGFFIMDNSQLNILAINMNDNFLHLVTAVLALYFGLAGRGTSAATTDG